MATRRLLEEQKAAVVVFGRDEKNDAMWHVPQFLSKAFQFLAQWLYCCALSFFFIKYLIHLFFLMHKMLVFANAAALATYIGSIVQVTYTVDGG